MEEQLTNNNQTNIIILQDEQQKSGSSALQTVQKEKEIASIHLSQLSNSNTYSKTFARFSKFMDKYFMLIGLAMVIPLSAQWPIGHNEGPFYPKITSSWIVTIILFFGIGLGIKIQYLKRACLFWQLNLFTHLIVFLYFPIIGFSIKLISQYIVPNHMVSQTLTNLIDGTIILCCLPATAASAVVFTHNAHGNEAAAAINCTLANLIGIFLTPVLILLFLGSSASFDMVDVFMKLSLRVIAPFFLAQIIRIAGGRSSRKRLKRWKPYIRKINEFALLYMVFCALSESFYQGIDASTVDISAIISIIILLHTHSYIVIWYLSKIFRCCVANKANSSFMAFTIYDRIAIMYAGASKTISLGIPLIETIFEGNENVGMYLIPILLYKPTCLIIGSILVEPFKKMVSKERTYLLSLTSTKSNNFADTTFVSQITNNTDYGALTGYNLTSFSAMDQDINSRSNSKVNDLPENNLMQLGDDDFDKNQSNYMTLCE